jgi:hypothetical protein
MAVVIDQMSVDVAEPPDSKKRGGAGGDGAGSEAGGEPPQPEAFERMWRQQAERAERVRAH